MEDWDGDELQSQAVYMGFIAADGWSPDSDITRMDFVRMTVGASGYGAGAELTGIWDSGFEDIPEADEGYAAIAKALGMISGESFSPEETCTRAAGAELLYRFMSRS